MFKISNSFRSIPLIRTQWQNKSRHIKHPYEQLSRETNVATPMDEGKPLLYTPPLLVYNRFHPLLDTDEEEDAHKIATSPSPPIILETPTRVKHAPTTNFRFFFLHILGRWIIKYELEVLHELGTSITRILRGQIH